RAELIHDDLAIHLTMVHLPALNTPQFEWVKSRLPRKPQPVPPIFQPEVAARAIYWAAHHQRRELTIGFPTLAAIIANKVLPGYLDRYLARHAYDAQQTDEPADPGRSDNLWHPLLQDFGAHGRFDDRAHPRTVQSWLTTHRHWLGAAGIATAAGVVYFLYTMIRWNTTPSLSEPAPTASRQASRL